MTEPRIPNPVAMVVGDVLGAHYYSHRLLNNLFIEKGAPGDPPIGNCAEKCQQWLKRASEDENVDALGVLGAVLEEFMEVDRSLQYMNMDALEKARDRVKNILARYGLSYHLGGNIIGAKSGAPSRSLEMILRARDLTALEVEFNRALNNVETDPPACITAACATIEALCKVYIEDQHLQLPSEQSIKPLWKVVQRHIGLEPSHVEDDDIKRVLSGLTSIVDGIGALRTHAGSAHGRGRRSYKLTAIHARLAINSAHTIAVFVLETWGTRGSAG